VGIISSILQYYLSPLQNNKKMEFGKKKNNVEFSCTNKYWRDAKKLVLKQLERGGAQFIA
jgi:hypothetical protein